MELEKAVAAWVRAEWFFRCGDRAFCADTAEWFDKAGENLRAALTGAADLGAAASALGITQARPPRPRLKRTLV